MVAKVEEGVIRTGEVLTFWVVTSASYLIPEELRELAHLRWDVENNGFKAANLDDGNQKNLFSQSSCASSGAIDSADGL